MSAIDARVEGIAVALADELLAVTESSLVGVYIHGSAVLGDFMPGVSDLDVLVVVEDGLSEEDVASMAAVLARDRALPASGARGLRR